MKPRLRAGQGVVYRPKGVISRYDGSTVQVVSHNRHGQVTIRFVDGPRRGQTRGVHESEVQEVPR